METTSDVVGPEVQRFFRYGAEQVKRPERCHLCSRPLLCLRLKAAAGPVLSERYLVCCWDCQYALTGGLSFKDAPAEAIDAPGDAGWQEVMKRVQTFTADPLVREAAITYRAAHQLATLEAWQAYTAEEKGEAHA